MIGMLCSYVVKEYFKISKLCTIRILTADIFIFIINSHYQNLIYGIKLGMELKYQGCGGQVAAIPKCVMFCFLCFCFRNTVYFYWNVFPCCIGGGMWQ
jgi:hypothetical protein